MFLGTLILQEEHVASSLMVQRTKVPKLEGEENCIQNWSAMKMLAEKRCKGNMTIVQFLFRRSLSRISALKSQTF